MNVDSNTAPIRPPPGPAMPGSGESPGPGSSPQHAEASDCGPSDSSKVISSSPFFLNAGELVISSTHVCRNASMSPSADASLGWFVHR
jgi:hypothetical protein